MVNLKRGRECFVGLSMSLLITVCLCQSRALTWIAALPDALEGKDQDVIDEILGKDITPASFENKATCDGKAANAFCYTLVRTTSLQLQKRKRVPKT